MRIPKTILREIFPPNVWEERYVSIPFEKIGGISYHDGYILILPDNQKFFLEQEQIEDLRRAYSKWLTWKNQAKAEPADEITYPEYINDPFVAQPTPLPFTYLDLVRFDRDGMTLIIEGCDSTGRNVCYEIEVLEEDSKQTPVHGEASFKDAEFAERAWAAWLKKNEKTEEANYHWTLPDPVNGSSKKIDLRECDQVWIAGRASATPELFVMTEGGDQVDSWAIPQFVRPENARLMEKIWLEYATARIEGVDGAPDRWITPNHQLLWFKDFVKISIEYMYGDDNHSLNLEAMNSLNGGEDYEFSIPDEITQEEAERVTAKWRAYREQYSKIPYPGTAGAAEVGCTCKTPYIHDHTCVVVQEDFIQPTPRLGVKGWRDPQGNTIQFRDCTKVFIEEENALVFLLKNGESYVYFLTTKPAGVVDEVSRQDAIKILSMWRRYQEKFAHLEEQEPAEPEEAPSDEPGPFVGESSLDELGEILSEFNINLRELVAALRPPERPIPYQTPIQGLEAIAGREPTSIERQCYLAGAMDFLKSISQDMRSEMARFLNDLKVPTVICSRCSTRIPVERAIYDTDRGQHFGIECCGDEIGK